MASWTLSVVGATKAEAKAKLKELNEKNGGFMPKDVGKLCEAAVDALVDTKLEGYDAVAVSCFGHFHRDDTGTSNVNLSVQHVNADALKRSS